MVLRVNEILTVVGAVDRERIPEGRRNKIMVIFLTGKSRKAFTKCSSVPIESGLRCKPHRSTYVYIRIAIRFFARLVSEHF
jgi:hypothetical protein